MSPCLSASNLRSSICSLSSFFTHLGSLSGLLFKDFMPRRSCLYSREMKVAIMSGVVTYVILITGRVTGDIPHGGGSMWNVTSWTHHNVTLQPQHDPRDPLYIVIRHVESARVGPSIVKPKSKSPCPNKLPNHNYQKYPYALGSYAKRMGKRK